MIYVYGPKDIAPSNVINTTSRSNTWSRGLSPFFVVPYNIDAYNVENVWQYSKVYKKHVDIDNEPTDEYYKWRQQGFKTKRGVRYPMGKGAIPLYSLWDNEKLGYIEARRKIYYKVYSDGVVRTDAYRKLYDYYISNTDIHLWDFDGYDYQHTDLKSVFNDPKRKMGHGFVLAIMLKKNIKPI